MNQTPPLLKSRKFWLMAFDAICSLIVYFAARRLAPAAADDVIKIIATLQPVVIVMITAITVQNVEAMKAASREQ